jgi:anthranilate phosphoribosyltransferase
LRAGEQRLATLALTMSIASYIKEIGRGKDGARSLNAAQAHDLMSQVLDGRVSDLEIGAFAIGMRIKGETTDELAGFLAAVHERCIRLQPPSPIVVLPSYNGARRLPNLTALLALLLARNDVPVLVHGPTHDPKRVTTHEIFRALGLPIAQSADDVTHAWRGREPAFIATEHLCPPLKPLLDARWTIGLRNPGHTVAKLIDPTQGVQALRVVNHTHPEYASVLAAFLAHTKAHAMLMRGTEGEPVADPRRLQKLDVYLGGALRSDLSLDAQEGVLTALPALPREIDAATTATYIRSVTSGEQPAPSPLSQQTEALLRAVRALQPERLT